MVQTDTFNDAMAALTDRFPVTSGDQLEIGVYGFPPARYRFVATLEGQPSVWQAVGEIAA
jgi:hypothetical protein